MDWLGLQADGSGVRDFMGKMEGCRVAPVIATPTEWLPGRRGFSTEAWCMTLTLCAWRFFA